MAHPRERTLSSLIQKALSWSPAVALTGMRQTGKTTLLRRFGDSYYNFDDIGTVSLFERERSSLLQTGPFPVILDEAQKFAPIFDALKSEIDQKKTPGRYLLTGSVRFSARKAIRESLTGRLVTLEIYPLTLAESHAQKMESLLDCFTRDKAPPAVLKSLEKRSWATESQITHYLQVGGLPGICLRREAQIRDQLYSSHLDTLFGRDIALVSGLKMEISRLRELFGLLCREQGLEINYSRLSRQLGVSPPTIRKALSAMESLFLIRPHGKTYFAEDLGLSSFVCRFSPLAERLDLVRFLFTELRANLSYCNPLQAELTCYQTRGGVDLPFVIRAKKNLQIAMAVDTGDHPSEKSLKSLSWFKKKYPQAIGVVVHRGQSAQVSPTGMIGIPFSWIP